MLPKLCLNTCLPSVHSLLLCAWSFRTRALISDHDYITLLKYITFVSKLNSKTILFLRYMHVYHRLKIHSPSKVQILPRARTCKTAKKGSCTKRPDGNLTSHSTNLQTGFSFTTTSLYNYKVQARGPWS